MTLEQAFEAMRKANDKMKKLAEKGLLDEENIQGLTLEYKTAYEAISESQTNLLRDCLIQNMTVKARDFFDVARLMPKDSMKQ